MPITRVATWLAIITSAALLPGFQVPSANRNVAIPIVPPRPADIGTIDGEMRAFYEVVNIAPDAPRQWGRDATLYSPWIRFVNIGHTATGSTRADVWSHQQLVDETEPMIRTGFREREIFRKSFQYGNIAHVYSTYESLSGLHGENRERGVNSIELYFDGKRWWIESAIWQIEDKAHPIPGELLPQTSTPADFRPGRG